MGDIKGFLKNKRRATPNREVSERLLDYKEISLPRTQELFVEQSSRCMDCGVPFCHFSCPIGNTIPDWNDDAFGARWERAYSALAATNNLPEVTGRICPAPCEYGCVLGINDDPVTIRENECSIIETAFKKGYVKPNPPKKRSGKNVAVIGSGPSGLSAADQLNKMGHKVTVFERDEKAGGILRYGIPDFKLEKKVIDRRLEIYKKEGIVFKTGVNVGVDADILPKKNKYVIGKQTFDAVLLVVGSRHPRDISVPGRELNGIHFAMDYLSQSNRKVSREKQPKENLIDAKNKKVIVIGGGDTGSDCVGTANRQGALSVTQIEVMPQPPVCRTADAPWPKYPMLFKTSSSHEEGVNRDWAVATKEFQGIDGNVTKLHCSRVEFVFENACRVMKEIPGSEFSLEADLVILAMGFLHPEQALVKGMKVNTDSRKNISAEAGFMTSKKGVFAAGDARRGASLIVWAIYEGRQAAESINSFLKR